MKLIDKYLIKQFLQTIFFGLLAFTAIFVVIDMMENLDDFIDQNVAAPIILHYYFVFTPEIIKLITPVSVLFAALFTAGKAASLSELTAIRASGVSMYRFMLPFLITTFLICSFSVYFTGYLVPMANKTKVNIERQYLKRGVVYAGGNIFFQDARNKVVSIAYYDDNAQQATRVSIQEFAPDNLTQMISRTDAATIVYDTLKHEWTARNVTKRYFGPLSQKIESAQSMTLKVNFLPSELNTKQQKPEEMNLTELKGLINTQQKAGIDPTEPLIEYYSRFSFPLASLIVVLFGLPISANKRKGGLALQVGINILVTFLYLVFMQISQAFGKNGVISPLLTVWIPNIIFLAGAAYNFQRMRQ